MLNQAYSEPLFLNIFICDLPFDDIYIDTVNYADDPSSYAYGLKNEKLIKLLKILISFLIGSQTAF